MSTAVETSVVSFPLERPTLRARWRDAKSGHASLPYFITGDENRLAHFACQNQTDVFQLGNPLLLTGAIGTGKTAIALHLAAQHLIGLGLAQDTKAVVYLPAIDFARSYAEAANSDDMPPFREHIDQAPVLVIDDLHLMVDKKAAQEELAARIEARSDAQKPTILVCRRLPSEIRSLRPRLVSRALHGLTIPLSPPCDDAKRLILGELALVHDLQLGELEIDRLLAGLPDDVAVPAIDAALQQVALLCRMKSAEPNVSMIDQVIESTQQTSEVAIAKVAQTVARLMGLKTADLRSSSRKQMVVRARSLAMYIARRNTSKSLDQIGKHFGGRDHSTVLHSIRKTESLVETDVDLHQVFNDVNEKLKS